MTSTTQARVTSAFIHPAMSALLTARSHDERGDTAAALIFDLEVAQGYVEGAIAALKASTMGAPYVVPVDPASLVATDCCQ